MAPTASAEFADQPAVPFSGGMNGSQVVPTVAIDRDDRTTLAVARGEGVLWWATGDTTVEVAAMTADGTVSWTSSSDLGTISLSGQRPSTHNAAVIAVTVALDGMAELWVDGILMDSQSVPGYVGNVRQVTLGTNPNGTALPAPHLEGAISDFYMLEGAAYEDDLVDALTFLNRQYDRDARQMNERLADAFPAFGQWVELDRGEHVLSWYEGTLAGGGRLEPQIVLADGSLLNECPVVTAADPVTVHEVDAEGAIVPGGRTVTWRRKFARFDNPVGGPVKVGLRVRRGADSIPTQVGTAALLAGMQVRTASGPVPTYYAATNAVGEWPTKPCEDATGTNFRTMWEDAKYEVYCPSGFGQDCAEYLDLASLPKARYREFTFTISQDAIDRGELIQSAGFARGNYNYRMDAIGVNVVGTHVLDCESATLPSTCYANNFVQYALRHDGPFMVRNHNGELVESHLYPGRIQQAKALAAERYLTNPVSGNDTQLTASYMRGELRGRPLAGHYSIRIYDTSLEEDESPLNWGNIEDVQLIIDYRYWTRLN